MSTQSVVEDVILERNIRLPSGLKYPPGTSALQLTNLKIVEFPDRKIIPFILFKREVEREGEAKGEC